MKHIIIRICSECPCLKGCSIEDHGGWNDEHGEYHSIPRLCLLEDLPVYKSEIPGARAKDPNGLWSLEDVIRGLEYISNSPPSEHGGFHDNAIATARSALVYIDRFIELESFRKLTREDFLAWMKGDEFWNRKCDR